MLNAWYSVKFYAGVIFVFLPKHVFFSLPSRQWGLSVCLVTHLNICKADIAVPSVHPRVLHHQPVLVHRPHLREDWHQLVLEAVPGDSGDIHLTAPGRGGALPPIRWPTVDTLPIPLEEHEPVVILKLIKFSLFKIIVFLIKALQIQVFKLRHCLESGQSNHRYN